jgi:CDP-diacylglycerol--serine O-phosphatidyltransferase
MGKLKTKSAKENILHRVRKQRLKHVPIFPSLVTILNGACGFWAIILAGTDGGSFAMAGYLILLAMIADVLDGRLARMSMSTSSFGGQLDSLCDMVSFGVAPAFLMLKILEPQLGDFYELNSGLARVVQRFVWLVAAAYVSCAAIRLARFNVENAEHDPSHTTFTGLPTKAAAGVIVSLVIFHQETLSVVLDKGTSAYSVCENIILYSLPVLALAAAALMISRIRYPHVINQYIRGRKPFSYFIRILLFLGLMIWPRQTALVLMFCGFAASGFIKWLYLRIRNPRRAVTSKKANASRSAK